MVVFRDMGRITTSVCKLCRREGVKLFLKGTRCESAKCAIERRNKAPGMHGARRSKPSEYGTRLREKQKLKRFYGLLDRQFARNFAEASRATGNTGEQLLSLMERRLDNVVYRLGWAPSRATARQVVGHGHLTVNGKHCDIPSRVLSPGDVVEVKNREHSLKIVRGYLSDWEKRPVAAFLERQGSDSDAPRGLLTRVPGRTDVDPNIDQLREQIIIEFCSR